ARGPQRAWRNGVCSSSVGSASGARSLGASLFRIFAGALAFLDRAAVHLGSLYALALVLSGTTASAALLDAALAILASALARAILRCRAPGGSWLLAWEHFPPGVPFAAWLALYAIGRAA